MLGGVPEWPIGTALKAVAGSDVSRGFESRPLCPGWLDRPVPSDYRFAPPLVARFLGLVLVALGLLTVAVVVLAAVLDLPGVVLTVVVVLVVAAVVLAGLVLSRLAPLVRLDDSGYRVRLLRGAGVRAARWRDVEDVVTATVHGHDCVVLRLRDGRTTTVPVAVLDAPRQEFVQDLRSHLDAGHGYRRIR